MYHHHDLDIPLFAVLLTSETVVHVSCSKRMPGIVCRECNIFYQTNLPLIGQPNSISNLNSWYSGTVSNLLMGMIL